MIVGEKVRNFLETVFFPNRSINKFMKDYQYRLRYIEITDGGFVVKNIEHKIENDINWDSVNDVDYNQKRLLLTIEGEEEEMVIPMQFHENWHQLIRKIPKHFPTCDYDAIQEFFEKLQGCDICGLIAVEEDGECMACGNQKWNSEIGKDFESKEAYIKQMQIYEFEPTEENEVVHINNNPLYGFESYPKWKAFITNDDFTNKS